MFEELEFKPHPVEFIGGFQAVKMFPNGFGVSVVYESPFFHCDKNTYEVGILAKDYNDNPFGDVLDYQTKEDVEKLMQTMSNYKKE